MCQIHIYPILHDLWRWEIRSGRVLLCCGTAPTQQAAESQAKEVTAA